MNKNNSFHTQGECSAMTRYIVNFMYFLTISETIPSNFKACFKCVLTGINMLLLCQLLPLNFQMF